MIRMLDTHDVGVRGGHVPLQALSAGIRCNAPLALVRLEAEVHGVNVLSEIGCRCKCRHALAAGMRFEAEV